jgi:putative Mg2+ transporter-C (MgtC) family protein
MDATPSLDILDVAWRLCAAVVAGMLIGLNRDLTGKPIGMRTLGLVSLGSAVVAVSTVHFRGLADDPDALARLVQGATQGVMAGIGFIGAGVILRDVQAREVKGLTTAATVWVTAALGLACGLAAWQIVALSVGLAVFLLVGVLWIERLFEPDKDRGYD